MNVFTIVSWISLAIAFLCAIAITADEIRHPQKMWIMNIVWPVTALYLSVFALWMYLRMGRRMAEGLAHRHEEIPRGIPFPAVLVSATHCGAGCALGDIIAEFCVFAAGFALFGLVLYADYVVDYAAAWSLGIVFQYFSIKPMTDLSPGRVLIAAIKADTLSITTFQIGMYGWMALVFFAFFPKPHLHPDEAGFWLMMQIAMVCGFVTSLPVNWLLLKTGVKHAMG